MRRESPGSRIGSSASIFSDRWRSWPIDVRLGILLRDHIDGVPLDLASRLLPRRTHFAPWAAMHLHWHARFQRQYADTEAPRAAAPPRQRRVSRTGLLGIVSSLERAIRKLAWEPRGTEWAEYYRECRYSGPALDHKSRLVAEWHAAIEPRPARVLDLGANTGHFSRLLADAGAHVTAPDVDPAAVERHYRQVVAERRANILPLLVDFANPPPALGWANEERSSFFSRASADLVLCLALLHHLAIGNNVPFARVADLLASLGPWLVIEFVPKRDEQVQRLLSGRADVFDEYTQDAFEAAFDRRFSVERRETIADSARVLYLMRRRAVAGAGR